MENLFNITGKRVAITGAAGVLGKEMAFGLAKLGAEICVLDYKLQRGEEMAQEIISAGGKAVAVECNVLEEPSVVAATGAIKERMGGLDVLINAAGGNKADATCTPPRTFFELDPQAIRQVFDLNCMGTILPTQHIGKLIADSQTGSIINISSMNAFRPLTRIAAYSAAKAAISNFTQWLSTYMAQHHSTDIRVNAIAPGFFLTKQNKFLLLDENGDLTPRGKTIIDHTPMGRFGNADELIGTLVWLISDAAKFVTGVVVPVDGGFDAFSGV